MTVRYSNKGQAYTQCLIDMMRLKQGLTIKLNNRITGGKANVVEEKG